MKVNQEFYLLQQKMDFILNTTEDIIWESDSDGRITFLNKSQYP